MRILMLGWEYPPVKSGGLGTACYGLTKEMAALGHDIIFVAPYAVPSEKSRHLTLVNLHRYKVKADISSLKDRILKKLNLTDEMKKHVTYEFISSLLNPYLSEETFRQKYSEKMLEIRNHILTQKINISREVENYDIEYDEYDAGVMDVYGQSLFQEVHDYALKAEHIAKKYDFDLIVAHDWMTFEAAVRIKKLTGKPYCAHIHATEFDRTGGNCNQLIYGLEYQGMHAADMIVANSHITKENCIKHFGIPAHKIVPVHLAIDKDEVSSAKESLPLNKKPGEKIVLFLGRLTMQKGPEYFLQAAAKAAKFYPQVRFIMAGNGEKMNDLIELASKLKISDKVFFTGFLQGEDIRKVLKMADLFILSSVAEPFGLVVLEAIKADVPCIISKTAGVAEILHHVLKVDYWDTLEMTNQMVNILKHNSLATELQANASLEAEEYTWDWTARRTLQVYDQLVNHVKGAPTYA